MPRTNAEYQARHREKTEILRGQLRDFLAEFIGACERGRCPRITEGIEDEDPTAALVELTRRLKCRRLIVVRLENGEEGDSDDL